MANRYFVNGGVNNNWGTIGNWSTTSGGAGGSAIPLITDDVFFDANSPNCTVDISNRVALSLTTTGYTNTITLTFGIVVNGAITLGSGTILTGSGKLSGQNTGTHTSNGVTIPNFALLGSVTHTLADNFNVGNFYDGLSSNPTVINGNQINISGNLDFSVSATGILSGTTNFVMTGTGSLLPHTGAGQVRNNITFNTAGTITGTAGTLNYNTGAITYTAGTVNMTAVNLSINTVATTLACTSAIVWNAVSLLGAVTHTLTQDLVAGGLVTIGSTTSATVINGFKVYCRAGLRFGGSSGNTSGTTEFVVAGTGTLDAPSVSTGRIGNKITIDATGAGTATCTSTFYIDLQQLKFVSGAVVTTNGTWAASGGGLITHSGMVGGMRG